MESISNNKPPRLTVYQFYNLINTVFIQLLLVHDVENPPFRTASETNLKKNTEEEELSDVEVTRRIIQDRLIWIFPGSKRCQASRWAHKRSQQKGLINGVK